MVILPRKSSLEQKCLLLNPWFASFSLGNAMVHVIDNFTRDQTYQLPIQIAAVKPRREFLTKTMRKDEKRPKYECNKGKLEVTENRTNIKK